MKLLSARSNDKIKSAVSIRDSSKKRCETKSFFLEGARLCSDAAENGAKILRAFFTAGALKKYTVQSKMIMSSSLESYEITDDIARHLSDTSNTQGIFCICLVDENNACADKIMTHGKYILLENVQDPSNLGAVSRTAEALGIDGMIVCGGCDIYNPKTLRASMGSILRLNVLTCDNACDLLKVAGESGMITLASTPDSSCEPITAIDMCGGVICVVGNEGNGVTQETANACMRRVTIPMCGRAESLNAATAAAILIWEMVRK